MYVCSILLIFNGEMTVLHLHCQHY